MKNNSKAGGGEEEGEGGEGEDGRAGFNNIEIGPSAHQDTQGCCWTPCRLQ